MKKNLTFLLIGTVALVAALIMSCTPASAQKLPDTTRKVPLHFSEVVKINQQLQRATAIYHKLDIPALKRDSIDMFLNDIYSLINRRAEMVYADTVKKGGKKGGKK